MIHIRDVLALENISIILSGVSFSGVRGGPARFLRVSDLSEIRDGRRPEMIAGEAPAVARASAIEPGDILVGARGSTTDVCVANEAVFGAYISVDLYLVRPDPALVDTPYLATFLQLAATQTQLAGGKQGTSLARLPKPVLAALEIPLPNLGTQLSIGRLALAGAQEKRLVGAIATLKTKLVGETIARAIRSSL